MTEKDPRLCPGCGRLGTPQYDRGNKIVYQCDETDGCTYEDAWLVGELPLPAGIEGPGVPTNGRPVDVEMEECPSCGSGPLKGKAWLIRVGKRRGEVCVRCLVCYGTLLGEPEGGGRDRLAAGVAGATNMILAAVERSGAQLLYEKFVRVSVAIGKREIREDVRMGHVPGDVASFGDLHDHRDANEYGCLCDDEYCTAWEIPKDLELKAGNEVQNQLDAWIKAGGLLAVGGIRR